MSLGTTVASLGAEMGGWPQAWTRVPVLVCLCKGANRLGAENGAEVRPSEAPSADSWCAWRDLASSRPEPSGMQVALDVLEMAPEIVLKATPMVKPRVRVR